MEQKKRNLFLLISTIIALIVSLYVLYETVFEQIISQSQGYFYAGVFGFILLLVFLLCNLFTKLIATSAKIQNSFAWRIIATVILGFICVIFIISRLRYDSQLAGIESNVYKTAVSLLDSSLYMNKDLVKDCLANSANFSYALVISIIFRIFGESSQAYIATNIVIFTICIILIYRVTMLISDRICGLVAAFLAIIIPSQTFNVYTYDSNPIFTLIVLLFIDVFVHLFSTFDDAKSRDSFALKNDASTDTDSNNVKSIVYTVILGIVGGFLLHIEFVMIVFYVLLVIASFITKRKNSIKILIAFAASLFIFALLTFVKSSYTQEDYGIVLSESFASFDPTFDISVGATISGDEIYSRFVEAIAIQDDNIESTYFFLYDSNGQAAFTDLFKSWILVENQLIYMFLLVMFISCGIIAMKEDFIEIIPFNLLFISSILVILFSQCRDINKHYYISLLIILTGVSIHYLYLNHHPEQMVRISTLDAIERTGRSNIDKASAKKLEETKALTEEDFVKRARALVFIGNDEDLYQRIKNDEHKKAIASGNKRVLENSFDDYDEDFFLDSEDDSDDNKEAPNNTIETSNVKVPAWKQKPEKFGEDNRYFDDEEDVYEDDADVYDDSSNIETSDVISVSEITKDVKPSSVKEEPEVEVIKRKANDNKKANKKQTTSIEKKNKSTAVNTLNNGKAVRRVKAVGAKAQETTSNSIKPGEPIPNPLKTPAKKEHKKIDYEIKETPKRLNNSDSGWDYAYDIDDNDDWDV